MTIIGDAFRTSTATAERIKSGPTKFLLMLAVFDGEHASTRPRLQSFEILRETDKGSFGSHRRYSFQAHIYGATWESGYWILEGVEAYSGMLGLVKQHSFIAQYDTEKKSGYMKFLD